MQALTVEETYTALGLDCWIIVPIRSISRDGHTLEGTRLTITQSKDGVDGHEFSIRTPVTPSRWDDFAAELADSFERICAAALADGACASLAPAFQRLLCSTNPFVVRAFQRLICSTCSAGPASQCRGLS